MSQTWNIPIPGTEVLSVSRTTLNNAFEALKTNWSGAADPTGGIGGGLQDGMITINTTSNKIKTRKTSAFINLGDYAAEMGHLRTDGTTSMTGNLNLNSFKITNLAAPVAGSNDSARQVDVETRLSRAGDTLNSGVALAYQGSITFADGTLINKSYADTNFVLKTNGLFTGRAAYSVAPPAYNPTGDLLILLSRDEIAKFTSFSLSQGHDHDGNNSKKVAALNLDVTGSVNNQFPKSDGTNIVWTSVVSNVWQHVEPGQLVLDLGDSFFTGSPHVVDVSGYVTTNTNILFISVHAFHNSGVLQSGEKLVFIRRTGQTDNTGRVLLLDKSSQSFQVVCPIVNPTLSFEAGTTTPFTSGDRIKIYLLGFGKVNYS
jgi:hypothetical protein